MAINLLAEPFLHHHHPLFFPLSLSSFLKKDQLNLSWLAWDECKTGNRVAIVEMVALGLESDGCMFGYVSMSKDRH